MTDNEIRVVVARICGLECPVCNGSGVYWCAKGTSCECHCDAHLPDYLNSHDALAPVLAGLSDGEFREYARAFSIVVEGEDGAHDVCALLRATPRQKCEALLLAKVNFDENNN